MTGGYLIAAAAAQRSINSWRVLAAADEDGVVEFADQWLQCCRTKKLGSSCKQVVKQ